MIGNGIVIEVSTSSPVSYTTIGQIMELDQIELVADKIARTYHSSSNFKRNAAGMVEVSDISFTLLHKSGLDESPDDLYDRVTVGTTYWWRVRIPDTENPTTKYEAFEFQASAGRWAINPPREDDQTVEVTLYIDGTTFSHLQPTTY